MTDSWRRRATALAVGISFTCLAASARADDPPLDDPATVKQLLAAPLPITERKNLSLVEAVKLVGALSGVNVYVDVAALQAGGYPVGDAPADRTVTVSLKDSSTAAALDGLVKSAGRPKTPLKWDVENGVVVFSTAADKNWAALRQAAKQNQKDDAFKDDRVLDDVSYDDVPLRDALKQLRTDGVNVYFHWDALASANVDPNNRVHIALKRVRPRTAVQLLVRQLAGPDAAVTFAVRDGVWMICTPDDLARQTRLWDAHALHVFDQATADKLATGVEEVTLGAGTFSDALDTLAQVGSLKFEVDWSSLQAAGIERSTPISVELRHVRLATAIDAVLTEAAGASHSLDYEAKDSALQINLKKEPASKPATKPATKPSTKPTTRPTKAAVKLSSAPNVKP